MEEIRTWSVADSAAFRRRRWSARGSTTRRRAPGREKRARGWRIRAGLGRRGVLIEEGGLHAGNHCDLPPAMSGAVRRIFPADRNGVEGGQSRREPVTRRNQPAAVKTREPARRHTHTGDTARGRESERREQQPEGRGQSTHVRLLPAWRIRIFRKADAACHRLGKDAVLSGTDARRQWRVSRENGERAETSGRAVRRSELMKCCP